MSNNTPARDQGWAPEPKRYSRLTPDAFVENAKTLVELGWPPIPLSGPGGKRAVVSGLHGHDGVDVTDEDTFREWADRWAQTPDGLNLGVRMPVGVLGIDVDCYDGKFGATTLAEHEQRWGLLPATWSVTARSDGSRKMFFRVPDGWTGRGVLGPGVETLQRHLRYSVAPPSVHDAGLVRAATPDGRDGGQLPPPAELPLLPEAWLTGLTRDAVHSRKGSDADASQLEEGFRGGAMTPKVLEHLNAFLTAVAENTNRYDSMVIAVMGLVRLGAMGERGADAALRLIEAEYVEAVTDKRGGETTAREEFRKAKRGGARIVVGDPAYVARDNDCGDAFGPEGRWGPESRWVLVFDGGDQLWQRELREPATNNAPEVPAGSSWLPVDVAQALSAGAPPEPAVLRREDGLCLFYAARVHSVHGESESGKSWLVQYAAAQQLLAHGSVLYVDFEDSVESVVGRLLALGVEADVMTNAARFVYVRPEEALRADAAEQAFAGLIGRPFSLAVIDGVTDSMGLFGYSAKDNDDIAAWQRELPRRIARSSGAAVVCIDHVTKDADTRGRYAIGGQHKIAGLDGAAYTVEVDRPFAVGRAGSASVRVGKDRPGHVRKAGVGWRKADRTQRIAEFQLDSTDENHLRAVLLPPKVDAAQPTDGTSTTAANPTGFRPTWFMGEISTYLEGTHEPEQRTHNKIIGTMCQRRADAGKPQRRAQWRQALRLLVAEGYVHTAPGQGQRRSEIHSSVKPYRQTGDPQSDSYTGGREPGNFTFETDESTTDGGAEA